MMALIQIMLACGLFLFINISVAADQTIEVKAEGPSSVVIGKGRTQIKVTLTAHIVDIGKASEPVPETRHNSCTYSRIPCSVVDTLEIEVGKQQLFVPRSAFADLADVNTLQIRKVKMGWALYLRGGDASEGYLAKIVFDSEAVKERSLESTLAPDELLQHTKYFSSDIDE